MAKVEFQSRPRNRMGHRAGAARTMKPLQPQVEWTVDGMDSTIASADGDC
jgi:hypothetical protein